MKKLLLSLFLFILVAPLPVIAQEAPVNYGPEWERIKNAYQQATDTFSRQRNQISNDTKLSAAERTRQIKVKYDQFMTESRQLAARRSEIIKIAAERSGLKYTLGSDPAKGRGMAGDIDLGGTPQQAKKFMQEMKNLGIADAFDNANSVQRKPGYVSIKIPMDVTVNYSGKLGQVGSTAYETQIRTDAFSKETYLSVAMEQNQPGRKAVETLDHLRKARQGLNVPAHKILGNPEAFQAATKGTFKAMVTMKVTDPELLLILKKSGLKMTPDEFLRSMDKIRKGNNIAPELAGITKENAGNFHKALDETARVCRNKAVQSFQNDMARARNSEQLLRQSKNPALRGQLANAKAGRIDSTIRMRENLNSLIAADSETGSLSTVKSEEVRLDNQRLKKWMGNIEKGVPQKPVGRMIFGENAQYRLPGADKVNNLVTKGIQGYQNFRSNAKVAAYAGKGMQVFGGAMIGASWYGMAKASGASDTEAIAAGSLAGLATLNRFGVLYLGAKDLEHHLTVKAKKYGEDQELSLALKGMDIEKDEVKDLINRRVLVRRGVYSAVKATSYSSVFYMNPALMVTGAALEAGLVVYEAYEEADLWQRYAEQLEKANHAMDEYNIQRGGWVSGRIAQQLAAQGESLNQAVANYHSLMKERDPLTRMRQEFTRSDEAYQNFLREIAQQMETMQAESDEGQGPAHLATLEKIQHQSDLYVAKITQAAVALQQNPDSIGSVQSVLGTMVSHYQSQQMQLDLIRPMITPSASPGPENMRQSPLASLKTYQQRLVDMESMLLPRYKSLGYLMNNNNKIAQQIEAFRKRHADYIASMSRYEGYLRQQDGAEATKALVAVGAARAKIETIQVPPVWQKDYADQLSKQYYQVRELLKQVQDSAKFVSSIYPEPAGSFFANTQPQEGALAGKLNRQWQLSGQAMSRFHAALAALHAQVAALVPAEGEPMPAREDQEDEIEYRDWDPAELRRELARLKALKKELSNRSDAVLAQLNAAYFADRDALWKAYEAAFKTPQTLACEVCGTQTLHSMDYSENPPHVWCNSCGRILSFMTWSGGGGSSLGDIRTRGQAKKAALQSQLATNQRAVDMAIAQVQAAL